LTEKIRKEIVQRIIKNSLDIQILKLIQTKPTWGYKIKKKIEEKYGIKLRHGTLYPLLNMLEQRGFLTSYKQSEKGRTRKIYKITEKGKSYLKTYNTILKEQIEQ